jgi:hypothetical protein
LRIKVQESSGAVTIKLEGRVAGPWVEELNRTWRSLVPSLYSKRLILDLCDVLFVNSTGKQLLSEIRSESGAEFLADTPMTKAFAEQATGGNEASKADARKEF